MRVRDLGPLLVEQHGRDQPVVGTKGSAMLALLTIHVNQQVSVDALTEAAWGDHVSTGAASTLLSHIWRLRQLLEPDRRSGDAPAVLLNDDGGYRLIGTADTVDSLFLAHASSRVRDDLNAGRLDAARTGADEALDRWRGRPYGRAADADWARPMVARLDELHEQLQERRIAALVGLGALDTALSDLRPLIAALPFHESLRALQMEALHRSGRTEQALEAFQDARRTLVDEVGIEPGRDLQTLHRRILDGDPTLVAAAPARVTVTAAEPARLPAVSPPRPSADVHLPPTMAALIGRDVEVDRIRSLVAQHRLVTISGPAGCGKTRLAVEVGRVLAETFADGVWFVDLVGVGDPASIADVVASTIGFLPSADTSSADNVRRYLATRRVLLVLDNCEHLLTAAAAFAEGVLDDDAPGAGSHILATSRERLGVIGEVGWTLEPLALPPAGTGADDPDDSPAVQLMVQRLRAADPTLELDRAVMDAVIRICVALDGLPLPLELAAARASAFSVAEIADQVSTDPGRLRRPGRGARDHRSTLHSTIDWSYQLLSETEQIAHRRLSVLPGPFTGAAAAAVLGADPVEAADTVVELVHRSMLQRVGPVRPGGRTTFRQLVTVRGHAAHALRDAAESDEIEDRRDGFVVDLIARRPLLGTTGEPAWFDALDDDHAAVRATLTRQLVDRPTPAGGGLAAPLTFYWYYRGRLAEATRWLTRADELLADGDPQDRAVTGLALAAILTLQGRPERAGPAMDAALAVRPAPGERRVDEILELLIGLVAACWVTDDHALLMATHGYLRELIGDTDSQHLRLLVDAVDVMATAVVGGPETAVAAAVDVQRRAGAAGVPMASWLAAGPPLAVALFSGRPDIGIPWTERCMADHFPSGTGAGGAFIETRANFAAQQQDHPLAARLDGAAHATTRRVGMRWPWRDLSLQLLDEVRAALPEHDFDRHWRAGRMLTPMGVLAGLRRGWDD